MNERNETIPCKIRISGCWSDCLKAGIKMLLNIVFRILQKLKRVTDAVLK